MNTEPSPLSVPAAPEKTNGLALASLILGILSLLACGVGIIFSIPGVICGILGLKRVRNSAGTQKGRGFAIAGLVMSAVSLVMLPVIGLMAAIAIPNFVKAREAAQRNACRANIRSIEAAKDVWALENNKKPGDVIQDDDVFGSGKALRGIPTCPKGGSYIVNPVGTGPECTVHGGWQ
jgi:competence protein ComGC